MSNRPTMRRQSSRRNVRRNFKSLLDPYNDDKHGKANGRDSADELQDSPPHSLLYPSFVNKSSRNSPKPCAIKIPSKVSQKKNLTSIKIPLKSDKVEVRETFNSSTNDDLSNVVNTSPLGNENSMKQPVLKLKKCLVGNVNLDNASRQLSFDKNYTVDTNVRVHSSSEKKSDTGTPESIINIKKSDENSTATVVTNNTSQFSSNKKLDKGTPVSTTITSKFSSDKKLDKDSTNITSQFSSDKKLDEATPISTNITSQIPSVKKSVKSTPITTNITSQLSSVKKSDKSTPVNPMVCIPSSEVEKIYDTVNTNMSTDKCTTSNNITSQYSPNKKSNENTIVSAEVISQSTSVDHSLNLNHKKPKECTSKLGTVTKMLQMYLPRNSSQKRNNTHVGHEDPFLADEMAHLCQSPQDIMRIKKRKSTNSQSPIQKENLKKIDSCRKKSTINKQDSSLLSSTESEKSPEKKMVVRSKKRGRVKKQNSKISHSEESPISTDETLTTYSSEIMSTTTTTSEDENNFEKEKKNNKPNSSSDKSPTISSLKFKGKRKRGRPRKNQEHDATQINKEADSTLEDHAATSQEVEISMTTPQSQKRNRSRKSVSFPIKRTVTFESEDLKSTNKEFTEHTNEKTSKHILDTDTTSESPGKRVKKKQKLSTLPSKISSSSANESEETLLAEENNLHRDMPLLDVPVITNEKTGGSKKHKEEVRKPVKRVRKDPLHKKKRGRKRIRPDDGKSTKIKEVDKITETVKKTRKKNQRRTGRRFSVTGNWYIAAGFLNDVISLLEDFDAVEGWRFADFAVCWRKKSFSLVYRGRQTFKELLEFSEEIALLTKRFLSPPHSVKRRIGALYTLYGLYHKFPLGRHHFFLLRFELNEYRSLLELIQPYRSNVENPDPAFIFRKLELDGAILHVASACEPCYDFHNEEREFVELEYGKQRLAKASAVSNAITKMQLQADADILRHYHSLKSQLAGHKNKPEKVLSMISAEFVSGIASNLSQLRQSTLQELDMADEDAEINETNKGQGDGILVDEDVSLAERSLDLGQENPLHAVNPGIVEKVNNGEYALRSQRIQEENEVVKNQAIQEFMRPPTSEDLNIPLRRQNKCGTKYQERRKNELLLETGGEIVSRDSDDIRRLFLDDNDFEPSVKRELRDALLPRPLPAKRKRGRKRTSALLEAATCYSPGRRRPKPNQGPIIVKTLEENDDMAEEAATDYGKCESATRISALELPAVVETTMIHVALSNNSTRKNVTLKIKMTPEAFKALRGNPSRYSDFKEKLKPLIKATQSGENNRKEWQVESINLPEEEAERNESVAEEETQEEKQSSHVPPSSSQSPSKVLPLKARFECLRNDDDEESEKDWSDDDQPPKTSWKTEEEKDTDYNPLKEEPEEEEHEVLEFYDEGDDYEDEDWVSDEPRPFWRRQKTYRKRRNWDGSWDEERGPRDSDQLLQMRSEKPSVAMVALPVGCGVKYFPMIRSDSPAKSPSKEPTSPIPKMEEEYLYTWNDFSSEKEPPFKKRHRNPGTSPYPYIIPTKSMREELKERKSLTKTEPRSVPPSPVKRIKIDLTDIPNVAMDGSKVSPKDVNVKTESQKVLEELADDWELETLTDEVSVPHYTPRKEKKEYNQDNIQEHQFKGEDTSVNAVESYDDIPSSPLLEEASYADEALEEEESESQEQLQDTEDIPHTNGDHATDDIYHEVTEILPDLAYPEESSYNKNVQVIPVQVDKNISLDPETLLPVDSSYNESTENHLSSIDELLSQQNISPFGPHNKFLYYKMLASDGNEVFIPVSSLSEISPQNIQILPFNGTGMKPFTPVKDKVNNADNQFDSKSDTSTSQTTSLHPFELGSDVETYPIPSSPIEQSRFPATYEDTPSYAQTYPVSSTSFQQPTFSGTYEDTPSYSETPTNSSTFVQRQSILPPSLHNGDTPSHASSPLSSTSTGASNDKPSLPMRISTPSSKPNCSFFFSPKLNLMKNLPTAKGTASGKPPSPEKPKVRFLFKGLLKS